MNKQQKHLIIAVIVGALIYFLLPEANGLTKQGISMLAVFIPTIYLWLTCGTGWTSLFSVTQQRVVQHMVLCGEILLERQ